MKKNISWKNIVKYATKGENLKILSLIILAILVIYASLMFLIGKQEDIGEKYASEQIIKLSQNIRRHYSNRPDFWGLNTQDVIRKKLYPLNMKVENDKLFGYFDNPVEIGADENGYSVMPTVKKFVIAYKGLSEKQCMALGCSKFNKDFWLGVKAMEITNAKSNKIFDWSSNELALPTNEKTIEKVCRDNSNIIFYLE